jgi:ABC-type sugar transport system permease subunit
MADLENFVNLHLYRGPLPPPPPPVWKTRLFVALIVVCSVLIAFLLAFILALCISSIQSKNTLPVYW